MSKAREIAEERYAKGEISEQEFEKIKSGLSDNDNRSMKEPYQQDQEGGPYGNTLLGIGGIVVAIVLYNIGANIVSELISECMSKGSSFEFCKENGVKGPVVYIFYGFVVLIGLTGIANLVLPKKKK